MALQEFCTVATYSEPTEAHLAKNFLDENGVRAFVVDENSAALSGWNVFIETKLQVAAADAERAMELLARGQSQ